MDRSRPYIISLNLFTSRKTDHLECLTPRIGIKTQNRLLVLSISSPSLISWIIISATSPSFSQCKTHGNFYAFQLIYSDVCTSANVVGIPVILTNFLLGWTSSIVNSCLPKILILLLVLCYVRDVTFFWRSCTFTICRKASNERRHTPPTVFSIQSCDPIFSWFVRIYTNLITNR